MLRIAPVEETPVPEIVMGSPIDKLAPLTCNAAPEFTVVVEYVAPFLPKLSEFDTTTTPSEIVVDPV
jgi:hypothetical protein